MSSAKLTIMGMYSHDNTLFDGMVLPDGIDKDLLIDSIIMKGGEYEVQYPDPEVLKHLIGSWSRQWYDTFYNWLRATDEMKQIAPLDNYNRHEEWGDTRTETTSHSENTTTNNSSESIDTMHGSGSTSGSDTSHGTGTVTNNTTDTSKISADDSADFVNKTQNISDNSQGNVTDTSATTSTTSATDTSSNATSTSNSATSTTSNNNLSDDSSHTGHVWGNIGVTTSATMFAEFYDVLLRYGNIYDCISIVFCQSFIIPISL